MGQILLVTGGCRSGKSSFAQSLAESLGTKRCYVATAVPCDEEMRRRIERHRADRAGKGWDTIEAPLELESTIRSCHNYDVVLCDCLTLWVNNHLYEAERIGRSLDEETLADMIRSVCEAARMLDATVIFVSNEVGMGIVPDSRLTRRFRDLVGRCNQAIAQAADAVLLVVSGIPVVIKGALDVQLGASYLTNNRAG